MFKRYSAIYPLAIILAGEIIRLWNLTQQPGWYDENYTVLVAGLPLPSLLAAVAGDVHPPAYYLIAWLLGKVLPVLPALRYFSAYCSIGSLVLSWYVSGLLGLPKPARLVGLAILAGLATDIYYSQESRMYSLLGLLVLVQVAAAWQGKWLLLWGSTVLALYTHNYSLFYSACVWLAVLPKWRKDQQITWLLLAGAAALAAWLPWAAVLAGQAAAIRGNYWIPPVTPGGVLVVLLNAWVGNLPGAWLLVGLLVLVLVLVLLVRAGLAARLPGLLVLGFGPAALAVLASVIAQPLLLHRGLVPSLPYISMLAGLAWKPGSQAARLGRLLLLLPWVVALGWHVGSTYNLSGKSWVYWPPSPVPAGSLVVHLEDTSMVTAQAAWETDNYLLDAGCQPQPGSLTPATRAALGFREITPGQLPERYYLAGVVSPLSTGCHEYWFTVLTAGQPAVYRQVHEFGLYGVWGVGQ